MTWGNTDGMRELLPSMSMQLTSHSRDCTLRKSTRDSVLSDEPTQ
jgi:hypothetical protein